VPCAAVPDSIHGSNFVMKLDDRTLPSGYRVTTENPRDVRVSRGKLAKLNFGAALHRVARVELTGAAFAGDGLDLLPEWRTRFDALPEAIKDKPSVLRLAYLRGAESRNLAERRLDALAEEARARWAALRCCYALAVETEIVEGGR
jgi:hypothetical protein